MASKNETNNKKRKIPDISFQDYLGIILRGKWIIISTLIIISSAAFIYTRFVDPVYKASASILINPRLAQPTIFVDVLRRSEGEKNFTQNEMEILSQKCLLLT